MKEKVAISAPHREKLTPGLASFAFGLMVFFLAASAGAAGENFHIVYNPPRDAEQSDARAFIEDEGITQTVSTILSEDLALPEKLTVIMGSDKGPSFDVTTNEVHMPYDFVYAIADRIRGGSRIGDEADIYDVIRDVYLHALLHNISHVLFVMYDLQTSGSREKAVDALTALLLIRYYENGGDIVLNAADLYTAADGSGERDVGPDFWTGHGFDLQSYNQAICLVYGSNPDRYTELRDRSEFLQIRDRACVREYSRQVDAWFRVLDSFLRRPPPSLK